MGRRANPCPTPTKRQRDGSWRLRWSWRGKNHEAVLGVCPEATAEHLRMATALALAGRGEWPPEISAAPAVRQYLLARADGKTVGDVMADYHLNLNANVSRRWAIQSRAFLRDCQAAAGPLLAAAPAALARFLDATLTQHTPATRNRALAVLRRFYRWAVDTRRLALNPCAGLKALKERESGADIIYLTRPERQKILAAARPEKDGVAVWLALLAGLRREELWRADWRDLEWQSGRLTVPRAKNRRRRTLPLPKKLLAYLKPRRQVAGRIVPWPETEEGYLYAADQLIARLRPRLAKIAHLGWTPFRHTFGSLLVQAGVSLDKVAAWMGNTPEVCRRHYAQFVPRDARDTDIDRG